MSESPLNEDFTRREGTPSGASRSRWAGLGTGLAALLVLGLPIAWFAFFGLTLWNGCFIECSAPDRPQAMLAFAVSGLLLLDVLLWFWAGLLRFPQALTIIACIPPALGVIWLATGSLQGAF